MKWATTPDQIGVATVQLKRGVTVARVKSMGIREALTSLVPKSKLEVLAREISVVKRQLKVVPTALF